MEELYNQYGTLLFTLAYQLTGSAVDAEDAVQDVFVKAYDIHPERLEEPKAYLCKMVTNHCLNLQKSARKRREVYLGPWLPEPIGTPEKDTIETTVINRELLSYAMLVLLERLPPIERTVFILREALGFDYPKIAEILDKREANCRKLMSRAKSKMGIFYDEQVTKKMEDLEWINRFIKSLEQGDIDTVLSLLSEDVMLVSDGGGKVTAFKHPIESRNYVARILASAFESIKPYYQENLHFEVAPMNGEMGILLRSKEETVATIFVELRGGKITRVYIVRNPDKLHRV